MIKTQQEILQNLLDAGCSDEEAAEIISALRSGSCCAAEKLLEHKRRTLLEEVHSTESRISCLDYLMHELKKQCFCYMEDKDGE